MGYPVRAYREPGRRSPNRRATPPRPRAPPNRGPRSPERGKVARPSNAPERRRDVFSPERDKKPPGGGGGGGPPQKPNGFGRSPLVGRNAWWTAFKLGWWLGDRMIDAGVFPWMRPLPADYVPQAVFSPNGWTVCCVNAAAGGAPNMSISSFPSGCTSVCTGFTDGSPKPGDWEWPSPTDNRFVTYHCQLGAGAGGSNRRRAHTAYNKPAGSIRKPAIVWTPGRIDLMPWVHPMAKLPLVTYPEVKTPTATGPKEGLLPEESLGGQPPGPSRTTVDVVSRKVFTRTRTNTTRRVPSPRRRPRRGREKKLRFNQVQRLVLAAINQATEFNDVVGALYDSIPDGACKKSHAPPPPPKGGTPPNKLTTDRAKANAVWSCFHLIDWDSAAFNLVWTQIEDAIWATLGLPTKPFGRPQGSNIGVNGMLSEVFGDSYADFTKEAQAWLETHVAKKLGITLV